MIGYIILSIIIVFLTIAARKFSAESDLFEVQYNNAMRETAMYKDRLEREKMDCDNRVKRLHNEISSLTSRADRNFEIGAEDGKRRVAYLEKELREVHESYKKQLEEQEYKILKKVCYKAEVEE